MNVGTLFVAAGNDNEHEVVAILGSEEVACIRFEFNCKIIALFVKDLAVFVLFVLLLRKFLLNLIKLLGFVC